MKKIPFEPSCFYYITNVANNGELIFREPRNYHHFLRLLKHHLQPVADLYAYCLIETSFYLVIGFRKESDLPHKHRERLYQPLSNFFNAYSKSINKMYGRSGSLFREHFHRMQIGKDQLQGAVVSIHAIPVRTGSAIMYKYSSFRRYLLKKDTEFHQKNLRELFLDKDNFMSLHSQA